jgi:hypothetical protein
VAELNFLEKIFGNARIPFVVDTYTESVANNSRNILNAYVFERGFINAVTCNTEKYVHFLGTVPTMSGIYTAVICGYYEQGLVNNPRRFIRIVDLAYITVDALYVTKESRSSVSVLMP